MHSIFERDTEGPCLGIIFEKGASGYYTSDALLYQDILLYFFEKRDNDFSKYGSDTFVFNDLAGWLVMQKNIEFTNYYSGKKAKTTKTSRINATRRRVQKRIDDLKDVWLLFEITQVKARKNEETTPLYCYSDYGKIIVWIVKTVGKSITSNERKIANEEIYGLLQSHLSPRDHILEYERMSKYLFKRAFFERCWKNGVFGEIVTMIIDVLHQNPKVRSLPRILDYIVYEYVRITNRLRFRRKLWDSFIEALDSLDEITRKIVTYYEKLDIERRIYEAIQVQSDYKASRMWEEAWFENRNEYSELVLLVFCNNCKYMGPGIVDYYEFKREAVMLDNGKFVIETADCPKCKDKGDILVSV